MASRRGKKIATWNYDDRKGTTLAVPVRQMIERDDKVVLHVDLDELDIHCEGTDINKLRDDVFAEIRAKLVLDWKWFLYIHVHGFDYGIEDKVFVEADFENPTLRFNIEVKVTRIRIAARPDGSHCHQLAGYSEIKEGTPHVGPGETRYHGNVQGDMYSLIPDTAEHRLALVDIGTAFGRLKDRLAELLHPDRAVASLASISETRTVAGLPAPAPEAASC